MSNVQLNAIVLAGGHSRRMGRDKAALEVDGKSQLGRTVALLESLHIPVYVSVRADQKTDPVRRGFSLLFDSVADFGPLAGIHAALSHRPTPWLVVACDLPRLDGPTLDELIAAHDASHSATAIRSEYDALPEPLCAIWSPLMLPAVEAAMTADRRCARKLLIQNDAVLIDPPSHGALDNANTPRDLERILEASA